MTDRPVSETQLPSKGRDRAAAISRWLLWASGCDFVVAAAFAVTLLVGPTAYSFFGVEFLAELAAAGSALPGLAAGGLVVLAIVAGVYARSGAGHGPRLPFLKGVLLGVAVAFLARGAWLAIELARVIPNYESVRFRELLLSIAAITIGFLHLAGWRDLHGRIGSVERSSRRG